MLLLTLKGPLYFKARTGATHEPKARETRTSAAQQPVDEKVQLPCHTTCLTSARREPEGNAGHALSECEISRRRTVPPDTNLR